MTTREEFYPPVAEEMYFYDGFHSVARTRSVMKSKTPNPAVKVSSKSKAVGERDLRASVYTGHEFATYLPRPRKTRGLVKQTEDYFYGNSGCDGGNVWNGFINKFKK